MCNHPRPALSVQGTKVCAAGTFDWMITVYKSSPLFQKLPARTQRSYDAALRLVSQHELKDKCRFGMLPLSSITPGAADRLFDKLRRRSDGRDRIRTAVLSVTVSGHARRKLLCAGRVISSAPRLSTAPELSNWAYPPSRSGFASGQTAFSRKGEGSRLAFRIRSARKWRRSSRSSHQALTSVASAK